MLLAILAASVVAGAPQAPPVEPPSQGPREREISVLTYNVRGLPWPVARGRGAALRAIGEELAALRRAGREPDLVLIQEGFRGEVEDLVRASGYAHWARGPGRGDRRAGGLPALPGLLRGEGWGTLAGGGLHVLSDLPIRDVRAAAYSACAGLDCLAAKGVMLVRVRLDDGTEVDVINTHLNARRASRAPKPRTLQAHHRQTDELLAFIADHAAPDRPLVVGGDFNVRNAPDRYEYRAEARPYVVVAEFCHRHAAQCASPHAAQDQPWLKSQDLQAFASPAGVDLRPVGVGTLFDGGETPSLSDHAGYLVRYRLSFRGRTPRETGAQVMAAADR